jgi:hypothetical protein
MKARMKKVQATRQPLVITNRGNPMVRLIREEPAARGGVAQCRDGENIPQDQMTAPDNHGGII